MTNDVNIYELDLPLPTREMVTENPDGSYSIFINAKLSHDAQVKAYNHAMWHINNNDFEKHDIQEIETTAHERS